MAGATMESFIPVTHDSHFPLQNLPYGIFSRGVSVSEIFTEAGQVVPDRRIDRERLRHSHIAKHMRIKIDRWADDAIRLTEREGERQISTTERQRENKDVVTSPGLVHCLDSFFSDFSLHLFPCTFLRASLMPQSVHTHDKDIRGSGDECAKGKGFERPLPVAGCT